MRESFEWQAGKHKIVLGPRTLVMGIVNVTPDSFSEGGKHFDRGRAVEHALNLLSEGADILDNGGESTRPGTKVEVKSGGGRFASPAQAPEVTSLRKSAVSADEELRRVVPVIAEIRRLRPDAILSIDTYKAVVARAAVDAGIDIVNDVSGCLWDTEMKQTLASLRCGVVLMHMRGLPEEWRSLPPIDDLVLTVKKELSNRAEDAVAAGIAKDRIVLDPGIGFGKNYEENYPLLAHLDQLKDLKYPLLAATSRKSFVGKAIAVRQGDATRMPPPQDRLAGTLAATVLTVIKGAHIVRVHDVRAAVDAIAVTDAIMGAA